MSSFRFHHFSSRLQLTLFCLSTPSLSTTSDQKKKKLTTDDNIDGDKTNYKTPGAEDPRENALDIQNNRERTCSNTEKLTGKNFRNT